MRTTCRAEKKEFTRYRTKYNMPFIYLNLMKKLKICFRFT